ncbi:MAG: M48 family metalloprotease [Burkholderiaceae bacterium]|nr:M48 family metalloprotease [Burkholderiaceae bacterium]
MPSFGDDGDLSLGAERRMGDGIARQILRDPDYIDDPLLEEYVEGIWQSLLAAARAKGELSPEMYERFAWRVMMGRDRSVNAFALPGGYFGIHLGLIGVVETRDELASVLAHELSHVTQRHISRSIAQQGRQTPVLIAAMVLGALAARKSPDATNAVLAGSQAVAMQSQLNYSRDMEREADRIGFNLMQPAGFTPQGFVAMFNQLQQSARLSDNGSYPYLRSHPMTTERIGDMQSRLHARETAPGKMDLVGVPMRHSSSSVMAHAMMAARARVLSDPGVDILRLWAAEPQKAGTAGFATFTPARQAAVLYAAALASMKLREPDRAKAYVPRLKTVVAGDLPALRVANLIAAELALGAGDAAPALALDRQARPELFILSQAQIAHKRAEMASQNLRTWVAVHPLDAPAWQLLASAYNAMGQPLRATRAEAEAQVALLDYAAAVDRFRAAQELVRTGSVSGAAGGRDFIEESIVDVRTRQVQELLKEQRKDEKDAPK